MRNSDILSLQLELDIIKTILVEEIKARAEIEVRTSALGDELKAANLHILEAYRQKEDKEMELNSAKSVIDALESQQIILINEVDELKKNSRSSAEQEKELPLSNRTHELIHFCFDLPNSGNGSVAYSLLLQMKKCAS